MSRTMLEHGRRLLWNSGGFTPLTRYTTTTGNRLGITATTLMGYRVMTRDSPSAYAGCYENPAGHIRPLSTRKDRQRTPTESEEDVVADRSTEDPLPQEKHHTIILPAGDAQPKPTESEEHVVADRSKDDPLHPK